MKIAVGIVGALCSLLPVLAPAQSVTIEGATPAAVVERLKAELLPQGFKLERADDKRALFTFDRGMVAQQGSSTVRGQMVHVTLELQIRFRPRSAGLAVTAFEEVVGEGNRAFEFRRPVESPAELDNIQRLLEKVRADLTAARASGDSGVKRDSTER